MSTETITDDKYEKIITQYSWWKNKTGRIFVIVWISLVKDESLNFVTQFYPDTIALLEKGRSTTEKISWKDFIALIEKGSMEQMYNPA